MAPKTVLIKVKINNKTFPTSYQAIPKKAISFKELIKVTKSKCYSKTYSSILMQFKLTAGQNNSPNYNKMLTTVKTSGLKRKI